MVALLLVIVGWIMLRRGGKENNRNLYVKGSAIALVGVVLMFWDAMPVITRNWQGLNIPNSEELPEGRDVGLLQQYEGEFGSSGTPQLSAGEELARLQYEARIKAYEDANVVYQEASANLKERVNRYNRDLAELAADGVKAQQELLERYKHIQADEKTIEEQFGRLREQYEQLQAE